jgi:3-oxoisoapionate kinase
MKKPLISFYGDDLTGSTDAMEALHLAGLQCALFLKPATEEQLVRLSQAGTLQAIGLAGTSRSESPEWMNEHLPNAFHWLKRVNADICHYKVCSTFDSAVHVGNIGVALEIGAEVFNQRVVPVVVGVPQLRRYSIFGNLFAAFKELTYRIDRHPVMSRHPVTPMNEADLRIHLKSQAPIETDLIDILQLQASNLDELVEQAINTHGSANRALFIDVADFASQSVVGSQLWRMRRDEASRFIVGSSGVEYALAKEWQKQGLIQTRKVDTSELKAVSQIAVVSGSCSEVTAQQIRHASTNGFGLVSVSASRLASRSLGDEEYRNALRNARAVLDSGQSVILYTALGPDALESALSDAIPHAVGKRLGQLLRDLVVYGKLSRAVVAGGDTSSHALREMEVFALEIAMPRPKTPGSPLCKAYSDSEQFDGMQLAFKGGQIGSIDYFSAIRDGRG